MDFPKHVYSRSQSVDCSPLQAIWNIHDAEHFAGTHRDTMLAQEAKIDCFTQNENQLAWQLITHKRSDRAAKKNKMKFFIDDVQIPSFNTFLPSLAIITLEVKGKLIASTVSMYPESPQKTRICLDTYADSEFLWWQKLLRIPQLSNRFRVTKSCRRLIA